ncbi:LysR family transcriptional regulator [Ramlibacter sp. AW1]|uniref:LysR family transcriptional regulator n=1 Tax=Ramlibacter aurantiacus TaxID=2801330 RepID=A0A936ZSL0_9BURK|nr:LysR substrate-binding domain-containing protein [Ramlibacter aurantiacus]MBL0421796.1 LysR family transcriptional regulator [Ramlibacter aurantiacus]
MNLKQLQYFVQVARHGSLSHAATALRMGQPALSRHIRALEVELRRNLFHRNGRGVVLTDAGARFLSYAQGALSQLESARAALDGTDSEIIGRVVVGMPPSVARALSVPLVQGFQQRYPRARIAITEGLSTALQEQLLIGRVDVAVMHNPAASNLLHIEALAEESVCLLSRSRDGDFARPGTATLAELSGLRLIAPANPHPIRSQIEVEATRQGIGLDFHLEVEALASIPDLVLAGCGHAVVPESVLWAGLPDAQLVARRLSRPRLRGKLALVSASRRPATVLASGTEALLRELLRAKAERAAA